MHCLDAIGSFAGTALLRREKASACPFVLVGSNPVVLTYIYITTYYIFHYIYSDNPISFVCTPAAIIFKRRDVLTEEHGVCFSPYCVHPTVLSLALVTTQITSGVGFGGFGPMGPAHSMVDSVMGVQSQA